MITRQTEFCEALYPDYHHKKKKKKFGEAASVEPFEVTRADAGKEEEEGEEKEKGFILYLDGMACEACLRASSDDPSHHYHHRFTILD